MNFWIILYAVYKSSDLNENIQTKESNKPSGPNKSSSNKDPKKKWKFSETAFEIAKIFILSGKKSTSVIINRLLGTNITDKDLSSLLNGPYLKT